MKRILTSKEYRFIKGLKELMTKYNAVISTDAQGKIEIVVNEDDEWFWNRKHDLFRRMFFGWWAKWITGKELSTHNTNKRGV